MKLRLSVSATISLLLLARLALGTVTIAAGDNVQAKLEANPGADFLIAPGTFNPGATINVHSGQKIRGTVGTAPIGIVGIPQFIIPLSHVNAGFKVDGSARDVSITDLDINSSGQAINSSSSTNLTIQRNRISAHGGHAITTSGARGLKITDNFFDHCAGADRSGELWDIADAELSRNIFYYVNQGFHVCSPGDRVTGSYNVFDHVTRMTFEVQWGYAASGEPGPVQPSQDSLHFDYNVVRDPYRPHGWTFGISVPSNRLTNSTIKGNYFSTAGWDGIWGQGPTANDTGHFGMCIEVGGDGCVDRAKGTCDPNKTTIVEDNICGGPTVWRSGWIVSASAGVRAKNNKYYGPKPGWLLTGEGGSFGMGSVIDQGGNTVDPDASHMPPPPKWVDRGIIPGQPGATTQPNTPPPPPTMTVTATTDPNNCVVTLKNVPAGVTKYNAQLYTNDRAMIGVAFSFSTNPVTLEGLVPGWDEIIHVDAGSASAETSFHTTGTSPVPWTDGLAMQPRVKGSPPPPPPPPTDDPVIKVEPIGGWRITHKSGKTETTP
jgi:hypothetical protein